MSSDIGKSLPASRRRAPAFAASAALIVLFAGYAEPARALGIFESLFGIHSQRFEPSYGYYEPPPVRRRVIVKRPRPKVELASLPPVREMPKVPKDPVVLSDAEVVAGLLKDPTLRRAGEDLGTLREHDDVADSTRRAVLALTRKTPQAASVKIAASPPRPVGDVTVTGSVPVGTGAR